MDDSPIPGDPESSELRRQLAKLQKINQALMQQVEQSYDWQGDASTLILRTQKLEEMVRERTRELEEANRKALAAYEAKSAFLANMSHEIRTPMNAVLGMADLLSRTRLSGEQRELIEIIQGSGRGLLDIIDDILDFSKVEAGKLRLEPRPASLRGLILGVRKLLAVSAINKGLRFELDADPNLPSWLLLDETRLQQVLVNLVGNAIKFTDSGFVRLRARLLETSPRACQVRFSVEDSGIGMDAATIGKLFHSFYQADSSTTRSYCGTGLGLAISQRLVTLMGGRIEVASEPGAGSAFSFCLPLELAAQLAPALTPTPATPDQQAAASPEAPAAHHVLVAEDNAVNRKLIQRMLERLGYRVTLVENGKEAVAAVAAVCFDAILMDCQMPVMDGIAATREIRSHPSHGRRIPILALTANVFHEDREKCMAAGMDDFLAKPISLESLEQHLASWVRRASASLS